MKKSVIDIGSNTLIHLIWDLTNDKQLVEDIYVCQLGKSLTSFLSDESKQKAIAAFTNINKVCEFHNIKIKDSVITATEWARYFKDGASFVDELKRKAGIDIHLITGEEEARLCFQGILTAPDLVTFPMGVIDMGGSSTEVILAEGPDRFWSESFKFGAVKLNHITSLELMTSVIKEETNSIPSSLLIENRSLIIACGTIVALMKCIRGDTQISDREIYDPDEIFNFINLHQQYSANQLREKYPHLGERSSTVISGARILFSLLIILKAEKFKVSERGLRHGVLYHWE